MEDNKYIVKGPEPHEPIPKETLGVLFWDILVNSDPEHVIMVSFEFMVSVLIFLKFLFMLDMFI